MDNEESWKSKADEFQRLWNFPNCIGAIDGKHVEIKIHSKWNSEFIKTLLIRDKKSFFLMLKDLFYIQCTCNINYDKKTICFSYRLRLTVGQHTTIIKVIIALFFSESVMQTIALQ